MVNFKFIKDILRDKGSTKYSITKTLAVSTFLFLLVYLIFFTLIFEGKTIDHTLLLELLGFTGGLVGLKNNWGKDTSNKTPDKIDNFTNNKNVMDKTDDDEGVF